MSKEELSPLWGMIAALGAGALFLVFWLGVGIPLPWSVGAGGLAYGALWLILRGGLKTDTREKLLDTNFVDLPLAKKVVEEGRINIRELREVMGNFSKDRPFYKKLEKVAALLELIVKDVEVDPRDAPAAGAFLGFQGKAAARLGLMAWNLEEKGASLTQTKETMTKVEYTLDRLITGCEHHLSRLQEDNVSELNAELEVLESSLGLERGFDQELEEAQEKSAKILGTGTRGSS